jgi:hypothetical protein
MELKLQSSNLSHKGFVRTVLVNQTGSDSNIFSFFKSLQNRACLFVFHSDGKSARGVAKNFPKGR